MKADLIKELFKVNQEISRIRRRFFENSGEMTRSEFVLLDYVIELEAKNEKQTISQVAAELNISNAAVSRTIKHLLAKGWLFRETLEEDRRNGIVKISEEGKKIYSETQQKFNQLIETGFQEVDEQALTQYIEAGSQILKYFNHSSQ